MTYGANTTYVAYTLISADEPIQLSASAIVDNRVFHNTGQVAWPITVEMLADGVKVTSGDQDARPLVLRMASGTVSPANELYQDFYLPAETARGLNDHDSHGHAATFQATLAQGQTLLFLASAEDNPSFDDRAREKCQERERTLLANWTKAHAPDGSEPPPAWVEQLVLAADQFVVNRPSLEQPDGKSVIAGYHWFEDWGRDTMISLPGLTLITGRPEVAAPILKTFAQFVSQGMLPNRFPDSADQPEYNTIDATLWYFQALRAYHESTKDEQLLCALYSTLQGIIDWHVKGTRYNIKVDPSDGLLYGGQAGVQLTWMDAKVGDKVITPRIGKPVEVNALWYNALRAMVIFAGALGESQEPYQTMAQATLKGFERFWNQEKGYCYDVLDGPNGHEALLRPNQIFAVSLPESPLTLDKQRQVVDTCAHALLTSHGLRSLAQSEPGYQGFYGGDQFHRDSVYHQGTVWAWLIGPFVRAHFHVYQDASAARRMLEPFGDHLADAGLGTISEIFDGDAPFSPKGCIAQAWSVAEVLRAWLAIEETSTS
jgi:predicted glycogen debranching enzyme